MELGPLIPHTAEHAVLEDDVIHEGIVRDRFDERKEPEDRVPRVLDEEGHAPLDEVVGDRGAEAVDVVGGVHADGLCGETVG